VWNKGKLQRKHRKDVVNLQQVVPHFFLVAGALLGLDVSRCASSLDYDVTGESRVFAYGVGFQRPNAEQTQWSVSCKALVKPVEMLFWGKLLPVHHRYS
jgi:hypothetical protein